MDEDDTRAPPWLHTSRASTVQDASLHFRTVGRGAWSVVFHPMPCHAFHPVRFLPVPPSSDPTNHERPSSIHCTRMQANGFTA
jgi:hypothetical protein